MFRVKLPPPPSVNRAFRNVIGRGRVETRDYRVWRQSAVRSIYAQVRADQRIGGARRRLDLAARQPARRHRQPG